MEANKIEKTSIAVTITMNIEEALDLLSFTKNISPDDIQYIHPGISRGRRLEFENIVSSLHKALTKDISL